MTLHLSQFAGGDHVTANDQEVYHQTLPSRFLRLLGASGLTLARVGLPENRNGILLALLADRFRFRQSDHPGFRLESANNWPACRTMPPHK